MRREAGPLVPLPVLSFLAFPCVYFPGCCSHEGLWARRNFHLLASFPNLQLDATLSSRNLWGCGCCPLFGDVSLKSQGNGGGAVLGSS